MHVLRLWEDDTSDRSIAIVGNRDRLDWYDPMTGWVAPFAITFRGVRPLGGKSHYLDRSEIFRNGGSFRIADQGGGLTIMNKSDRRAMILLDLQQNERVWREEHTIEGGGELSLTWPESEPGLSQRTSLDAGNQRGHAAR